MARIDDWQWARIFARAMYDSPFRSDLMKDPKQAVEDFRDDPAYGLLDPDYMGLVDSGIYREEDRDFANISVPRLEEIIREQPPQVEIDKHKWS